MDFSKIDTGADAARGAWLHFTHPQLGHPLYTGDGADAHGRLIDPAKPHEKVQARVMGLESEVARARMKAAQGASKPDQEDDRFVASLVMELRGVTDGKREIGGTVDDVLWLFGRSLYFKAQIMAFAVDASNFFGAADI